MGIGVGMVACCGQVTPRRQEYLLYMTISILMANVINAIVSEWGFYTEDLPKLLIKHQYHLLVQYASLATRIAAAAVIGVAFVDSQLTFCSMQTTRPSTKKKLRGSHEQVSDIEYIIPRPKSSGASSKQVFNAYNTQSWVFESDNVNAATHAAASTAGYGKAARLASASDSPYLKLPQDARTPKRSPSKKKGDLENGVVIVADTTYLIDNPMVQVEEASDDSTSNSDRKLCYMKSFSRSASPAVLSASSSQISLNQQQQLQPQTSTPIYECLEKLTQPETFRSRLDSSRSNREDSSHYQTPQVMVRRADSASPQIEQVQYASLMKELQKAIGNKKEPGVTSPPSNGGSGTRTQTASKSSSRQDSSHSDGKNSDAEFSKELEAALQLIQDLESPNTIETPSDTKASGGERDGSKPMTGWRDSRSDSEKTLSAVGSLAEIGSPLNECQQELYTFKPSANGKSARIVVQYSDSQSTSGYSSPTHNKSTPKCWSTTSSLNGSNTDLGKPLSYTIHNTKSTAVISLFTSNDALKKGKSVTLVNISGDNQPIHEPLHSNLPSPIMTDITNHNQNNNSSHREHTNNSQYDYAIDVSKSSPTRQTSLGSSWNVKSLLRRKKQTVPKLCPELEGAIVKSESLAYLTELELLARHQRNKDIQRVR